MNLMTRKHEILFHCLIFHTKRDCTHWVSVIKYVYAKQMKKNGKKIYFIVKSLIIKLMENKSFRNQFYYEVF